MSSSNVAVVGMGIISSIGDNITKFKLSLKDGVSGVSLRKSTSGEQQSTQLGAEIRNFSFADRLNDYADLPEALLQKAKRCAQRSPFAIQVSVLAALEAWLNAKLFDYEFDAERIGVVIAGESTTSNYRYGLQEHFENTPAYLSPKYALQYLDSHQVGVLSEIFTIKGEGLVVGGASASGNVAIIKALQMIQLGIVDTCLVVGVVADLSPIELQGFVNIGAMVGINKYDRPDEASRPFDAEHSGFVYGQASGCVILQSCDAVQEWGNRAHTKILGSAVNLDGVSTSEPSVDGETQAMNSALAKSGISATEVEYLNAHGSSSPLGDTTEVNAIKRVFKGHVSKLWVNSTKSLTGHCLYSAGLVEFIASILQMESGFIHPNKNLEQPIDSDIRFSGATFEKADTKFAMSNSFGFGGINTSIVFQYVG